MLFKEGSVADEVRKEMQKNEISIAFQNENRDEINKIKMLEEMNKAAEVFEDAGFIEKAAEITALMEKLANKEEKNNNIVKQASSKKEVKKGGVYKYGMLGFSPDELRELGIDGFEKEDKEWEDE